MNVHEKIKHTRETNAKYLNLSDMGLTTLPKELFTLTNLTSLSFERNKIKTISEDIGNLVNLRVLFMQDNKLIKLPVSMGCLTNLDYLDLMCNWNLTELPMSMNNMNLSTLYTGGTSIPPLTGKLALTFPNKESC